MICRLFIAIIVWKSITFEVCGCRHALARFPEWKQCCLISESEPKLFLNWLELSLNWFRSKFFWIFCRKPSELVWKFRKIQILSTRVVSCYTAASTLPIQFTHTAHKQQWAPYASAASTVTSNSSNITSLETWITFQLWNEDEFILVNFMECLRILKNLHLPLPVYQL